MTDLSMNSAILQARLRPLYESLRQTQQLINRLSKLSAPSGSSSDDSGDVLTELSEEIHQSLKEQEDEFELIQQDSEDLTNSSSWARRKDGGHHASAGREREKADLASSVTRLGEDLKTARIQFRKAQLQAKHNTEASKRKEREAFLSELQQEPTSSTTSSTQDQSAGPSSNTVNTQSLFTPTSTAAGGRKSRHQASEKLSQDEILLGASNDVTAALRRTHALLTGELERSQFARETLESSTRELAQLTERYSTLDTLLASSKGLVSTLIHSRKSDTWYLETTVYILAATIGWLVFRRILYGPGWWLLYLPLRLTWWVLYTVLVGPALSIFGAQREAPGLGVSITSGIGISGQSVGRSTIKTANRRDIPTRPIDMPAPSIRAGGGGSGAKEENPIGDNKGLGRGGGSLVDEIGEMAERGQAENQQGGSGSFGEADEQVAEGSQQAQGQAGDHQGTVLRERTAEDGPPNPKKRMWEEPIGDASGGRQPRDEL